MNGPLLSIVVPAYNLERYLGTCLGAILGQMTAAHELILIDDGSTDGTGQVAAAAQMRHPDVRMHVLSQPNQGIAATRNRGLAQAQGEYIVFVDGDDVLRAGALAEIEHVARTQRPDAIACGFNMWDAAADARRRVELGYESGAIITCRDTVLMHFFTDRHMYVWANIVRRSVYAQLPQPVFPASRVFEDVAVLTRLLCGARSLVYIDRPVIDYRQHPASITKTITPAWCHDLATALGHLHDSVADLDVSDAVRMQVDATVCHLWIGMIKGSYQLTWSEGRAVRAAVKTQLAGLLFHPPEQVLAALHAGALPTPSAREDRKAATQIRRVLDNTLLFEVPMFLNRRLKERRRLAKLRRHARAIAVVR